LRVVATSPEDVEQKVQAKNMLRQPFMLDRCVDARMNDLAARRMQASGSVPEHLCQLSPTVEATTGSHLQQNPLLL